MTAIDPALVALLEATVPPASNGQPDADVPMTDLSQRSRRSRMRLYSFGQYEGRASGWLWDQRIPLGALTVFGGQGGLGKSTVAVDLAARVTRGELDGDLDGPRDVLLLFREDAAHVVESRFRAAAGDLDRLHTVALCTTDDPDLDSIESAESLRFPLDVELLEDAITESGASLVIVDPIIDHLTEGLSADRAQEVRRALGPLASMLARLDVACIVLHHLNKRSDVGASNRLTGSSAWRDVVRSVALFANGGGGQVVIGWDKANLAEQMPSPLAFELESVQVGWDKSRNKPVVAARVEWVDVDDDVSLDVLLDPTPKAGTRRDESKVDDAAATILAVLAGTESKRMRTTTLASVVRDLTGAGKTAVEQALVKLAHGGLVAAAQVTSKSPLAEFDDDGPPTSRYTVRLLTDAGSAAASGPDG